MSQSGEQTWEVGEFTLTESGTITGPAAFMESEQYARKVAEIQSGRCPVFNYGAAGASPSAEVAFLVSVQTEYAAWKGAQLFRAQTGAAV